MADKEAQSPRRIPKEAKSPRRIPKAKEAKSPRRIPKEAKSPRRIAKKKEAKKNVKKSPIKKETKTKKESKKEIPTLVKPATGYVRYMKAKNEGGAEELKGKTQQEKKEIKKTWASAWKTMSKAEKKVYVDEYQKEKKIYEAEIARLGMTPPSRTKPSKKRKRKVDMVLCFQESQLKKLIKAADPSYDIKAIFKEPENAKLLNKATELFLKEIIVRAADGHPDTGGDDRVTLREKDLRKALGSSEAYRFLNDTLWAQPGVQQQQSVTPAAAENGVSVSSTDGAAVATVTTDGSSAATTMAIDDDEQS